MNDTDRPLYAEGEPLKPYDVRRIDSQGYSIGESLGRFDTAGEAWALHRVLYPDYRLGRRFL